MDKFIVSARKYRPATFNDVVGQSAISTTLKNSILNHHLGHAYLFSGPRGVGKTTCARIFARTINCFNITEDGEACNTCESCISFNENRSYSIHELDAASNNSVDDIRLLTEQVRIPPQIGSYSIYIIDEVHMLSQQAFNAFLKTLEEPPPHAVFILATTEKHKIIPTILSRCQIFDFNRIGVEDAAAYLKSIADKESLTYEEDALHVIAQKADGAMRDALSIFDQVVSFSGDTITYQKVIKNLNILDYEYFFRLTSSALEGDAPSMLLIFNEVLGKGFDARNFINGYAAHLRDLMVCKDPATVQLMEVGAGIREKYLSQSQQVPLPFLYEGLDICNQADIQFRASRNQRLTVELALVKLANLNLGQKKKQLTEPSQPLPESTEKLQVPTPKPEAEPSVKAEAPLEAPAKAPIEPPTEAPVEAPAKKVEASEKGLPKENAGNENRVVHNPSISIKASLKKESVQAAIQASSSSEVEQLPGETVGVEKQAEYAAPDPDRILKAWNDYAKSIEKEKPRVFSTLQNNRPVVNAEGNIRVLLNTEGQRDNFQKNIKGELSTFIREATGIPLIEIITEVLEKDTENKKIYTDQDRLAYLTNKNPELGQLKTRFGLDFDD